MDIFEQRVKVEKGMLSTELKKGREKCKGMCIFPQCPIHTSFALDAKELLFCIQRKSFTCISAKKGCICPKCLVTQKLSLKYRFFCTKGAEKARRYEHALWGTTVPYTENHR
jgi:hypothetical protein